MKHTKQYIAVIPRKGLGKSLPVRPAVCLVSLAYVFGNPHPVMINVKSDQEALDQKLLNFVKTNFDLRPPAIVERLNLYNFHYTQTATYGHFCNSKYPWEQIIKL